MHDVQEGKVSLSLCPIRHLFRADRGTSSVATPFALDIQSCSALLMRIRLITTDYSDATPAPSRRRLQPPEP